MYKSDMERCEPSERWRDADDVWLIVEKDIRRQVLPLTRDFFQDHVEGDILEDSDAGNLCDKRRHYLDSYVTLTKKVKGFFDAQDEYPEQQQEANEDKGNVAVAASSLPDTQIFEDTDLSKRQELWSLMVGKEVINQADRLGIARFWKTHLPDGPLHRDEVDHWIETQATDSAVDIDAIYWALELIPPTHRSRPYRIAYSYLGSGVAFQTIKKAGWVFEQLAILADRLTRLCPWSFGQAVWFLLTREPAAIPQIRSTFSLMSTEGGAPVSHVSITMKIDSETTPAEVAAHYRRILKKIRPGVHRKRSEKQLLLVDFVWQHPRMTFEQRMVEWNRQYPKEWHYEHASNMGRDYTRGLRGLYPKIRTSSSNSVTE